MRGAGPAHMSGETITFLVCELTRTVPARPGNDLFVSQPATAEGVRA